MTDPERQPEACPVEQVERLAHGPADQPVPEDLCRHLEQCAACRARLEAAAAPEIDWVRVRRVLKEQPAKPDAGAAQGGLSFSLLRLLGPSDDPRAVGKIGPFEVTEVIGSGGMGMVLKARDPALDRHVAIKILAPHLASSATARRRFAREARAAAAVIHDHVIAIYQVSEHQELPYLVMPYLPDPSLQQRLDRDGKLDLESALSIGLQVAGGLEAAHAQGLIHRDVKPANVLLAKGTERAIITDFGLARAADDASLTSSGVLAGTPHYMSPEQARGEPVDFRSDLFSLGSLVFAMLTGQPPVNRELGSETIRTIATQPMPPLRTVAADAPEWAERLVGWLHQPKPEDRPESARQVAETLEQCLKHVRSPQAEGLPERLTRAEETEMGHPNDKRLFSLIALGLFLAVFLTPPLVAMTTRGEWALAFGGVAACLALFFGCLSWGEKISKLVVVTLGGLVLVAGLGLAATWFYMNQQDSRFQEAKRDAMRREDISAEEQQKLVDKAVALQNQRKEAEKEKAGPKGNNGLPEELPGMGMTPGGMAGPGAGMPGMGGPPGLELPGFVSPSSMPGMGGPPALGGGFPEGSRPLAEELKEVLGVGKPVLESKKPIAPALPQLAGTWLATKAIIHGKEVSVSNAESQVDQRIWLVGYGNYLYLTQAANPDYDPYKKVILGSGNVNPYFRNNEQDGWFFRIDYNPYQVDGIKKTVLENASRGVQSVNPAMREICDSVLFNNTYSRFEAKDGVLRIAFSEKTPRLTGGQDQIFFEMKRVSERVPVKLHSVLQKDLVTLPFQPIQGEYYAPKVSGLIGSWKIGQAMFQGIDFLTKQGFENLVLLSDGATLMILDAPSVNGSPSKRRVIGMGELDSWEPVRSGSFRIQVELPSPQLFPSPQRAVLAQFTEGRYFVENDKLNLSFLPLDGSKLDGQVVSSRNDLHGHKISNDPILKMVNNGKIDGSSFGLHEVVRGSPFPFTREPDQKDYFWNLEKPCSFPTLGELYMGRQSGRYMLNLFGTNYPEPRFANRIFEKGDLVRAVVRAIPDTVTMNKFIEKFDEMQLHPVNIMQSGKRPDGQAFVEIWFPENATREQALAVKEKILASGLPLDRLVVHFSSKASDELVEPIRPKKVEAGKATIGTVKPEASNPKPQPTVENSSKPAEPSLLFAEELKKALGEEVPVPEWKKPKYTPVPQLSGTWVATKAYLNGEEFKSQDKGQGIAMVCYGDSILLRFGRSFYEPELELGSGQIRLVPGGKDNTFIMRGYAMNPNTYTAGSFQRPIFGTLELKGEKLKIAFSENEPALGLGPKKGQDYYEFQAFSQRIPEGLNPILPIQGKKFFCSSVVDWVNFPLLKGIWFCENAQFRREANLNYSKLDPKRFVLTGDGNGLIIYYQAPRHGTTSAEPDVKDRFPTTTWPFWAWSPGGKGPIEVGKLLQFGIGGSEFLNYEIKGNLLHLTVADSIEGLGRDGRNDVFVFKKVTENWLEEEWKGEKLEKKLEIHAQKDKPMSLPDMSQEKPKDGGKESGKPKEVPAGKEPGKAADGKEKGK